MSTPPEILLGFSRICPYRNNCRKLCTLGVTHPKNTVIYLPVINNKIIYDYVIGNQFNDTICFSPDTAMFMAYKMATHCIEQKTR